MRQLVLPFDWDVKQVWRLDAEIEEVASQELDFLLVNPFWSQNPSSYLDFDLKPMDVIKNTFPDLRTGLRHRTRVENADTSQPLDFIQAEGRLWILDGIHRLAKIHLEGMPTVKIRRHDLSVRSLIEVRDDA